MVQAYLSGPIIHDHLRQDDFYRVVVDTLENAGVTVFAPQFLPRTTPRKIFIRDTGAVRQSDVLIAEVSHPSHGVGMEIMLAVEMMIPVLLFRMSDAPPLSYMVQGASCTALFNYDGLEEVRRILSDLSFDSLLVRDCPYCSSHVVEVSENGARCIVCGSDITIGD